MVPKIVTRLANIAAKMAGSDKYDPTVEPVTAFEYYLNKAADKVLSIRGLPSRPTTDKNLVLVSTPEGEIWEEPSVAKSFTVYAEYPESTGTTRPMTDAEKQLFESVYDCLSNDVPFTIFFNEIYNVQPTGFKNQMFISNFKREPRSFTAEMHSITQLVTDYQLTILTFAFAEYEDKEGNLEYKVHTHEQAFSLTEIQGG